MTDDVRVPISQMSQAWSDIQGYTSNMWQIAALCLTVVALSLNIFLSSIGSSTPPPSWTWQAVIILAFAFVIITIYTIQWLRSSIVRRVIYIMKTEETISGISSKRSVVGSADLFNVTEGPMKALLYFFYLLASVLGILAIYPLFEILASAQLTPDEWALLISLTISSVTVLLALFFNYRTLRRRERLVGATAETTVEFDDKSTELSPLKLAYTNTVLKQVFGSYWHNFDVSIWHNKDEEPWKIIANSIHFPESLRLMELPYPPILEFLITKELTEWYYDAKSMILAYPLLEDEAKKLANETNGLWIIRIEDHLIMILREIGDVNSKLKQALKLRDGVINLIDELGMDFFLE